MQTAGNQNRDRVEALLRLLPQRIVVLDGAMGTMIQTYRLDESGSKIGRAT